MQLESVGPIAMGRIFLQVSGKIDNLNSFKRAFLQRQQKVFSFPALVICTEDVYYLGIRDSMYADKIP